MIASNNLKAAVIGWPVKHSLSPRLHGYWLKQYGIAGSYDAIEVEPENLVHFLGTLASNRFCGVNLTVPHKETALDCVDIIQTLAVRVGAINTIIINADGKCEGRNTDVFGFTENLKQGGYKPDERPVTLLGAGGAARAALVALIDMGVKEIRIVNRTLEKSKNLSNYFPDTSIPIYQWNSSRALENAGLLVNATSLGMAGQPPLAIDLDALPCDAFVSDMVYAPLMTELLLKSQKRGNPVIDGLGMLLHQARPAFAAFFGEDPEVTPELRQHVLNGVG
jgi:shikimate dehydrogenase